MKVRDIASFCYKWLKRLPGIVVSPITRTPGLFGAFFVILTLVPVCNYCGRHLDKFCAFELNSMICAAVAWGFTMTWCFLAVYGLLGLFRRWAAVAWLVIVMIALGCNWIIDLGCMLIYGRCFTRDLAGVFLATNPEEGMSFISTYFDAQFVRWMAGSLLAAVMFGYALRCTRSDLACLLRGGKRWQRITRKSIIFILFLFTARQLYLVAVNGSAKELVVNNIYGKIVAFCTIDLGVPIVLQHPDLILEQDDAPTKVVVIIGESHARSHSQLYGYSRETQPLLTKLAADSSLIVFHDPVTPATSTMAAFRRFIGTWDGKSSRPWNECVTWIETSQIAGYPVTWVSNQSPKGVYDNPLFRIASICDDYAFTNDGMMGISHRYTDERILPLIDSRITDGRQMFIVHMMGSHVSYHNAYPPEETYFVASDYGELPGKQRSEIAAYDNSVRFNDKIVKAIIDRFVDEDAVVIYFSDHSQDLYESSPDYRGHARGNNKRSLEAGRAIPFYIYMSPKFRSLHPGVAQRIVNAAPRGADTDNLIYTIMDLTGASFADDPEIVRSKSIIR